jgi:hypothetical protein
VPFDIFWSNKITKYVQRNLESKNFFEQFTRNRLTYDSTRHHRIGGNGSSSVVPAREDGSSSSSPLVSPKVEVIDLIEDAELECIYKHSR